MGRWWEWWGGDEYNAALKIVIKWNRTTKWYSFILFLDDKI